MSPAMVELRDPTAGLASPQLKPYRSQTPNRSKGQIFFSPPPPPPPPLFDRSGISSINRAPGSGAASMDTADLPPFPFPPPAPAPGKPSPAPGLSKPRLLKVRRQLASARARSPAVPEGTGFNPFQSAPSVADHHLDLTEDVQDRLCKWNPYVPVAGTGVSESSTRLNSGNIESFKSQTQSAGFVFAAGPASNSDTKNVGSEESGNSDVGTFVFQSGVNSSSILSQKSEGSIGVNSGSFDSAKSEAADFVFCASTINDGLGNTVRGAFGSGSEESGNFDSGVFVFGVGKKGSAGDFSRNSSLGSDDGSFSKLPDEMRKLNLQGTGNGANVENATDGSGNSNAGVFVFGCGVKNDSNLSQSSSLGSDEGLFSSLPDEMRKLKLQSTGNNEGSEKTEQADYKPKIAEDNAFVFEGRKSTLNEKSWTHDPGFFVFGSGLKSSSNLSQKVDSDEGLLSQLPDDMRKLNLQSAGNVDGFEKSKQGNFRPDVNKNNTFVFGDSMIRHGVQSGNPAQGGILFGSAVKNGSNSNSSLGSDEGSCSQLPDEMRKLNLQSAGKADGFQKTQNNFNTGGSGNVSNSFDRSAANKLPEEMKKSDIGRETTSQNMKGESVDFVAGVFVFGSSSKTSSVSSQASTASFTSLDKGSAPGFQDDIKKSDAQGSRFDFSFRNTRGSDSEHKVDVRPGFVFGSSNNATVPIQGAAEDKVLDDTGKLDSGSGTDNLGGGTEQFFLKDGSVAGESTPFKFNFQAEKQGHSSRAAPIPQLQTNVHVRPNSGQFIGTEFTFTSMHEGLDTPHMEFTTKKHDTFPFYMENLCTSPHQSMAFSLKGVAKATKARKRRGKSGQSTPVAKQFISREKISLDSLELETPGDYSPMDYSPYQENLVADQCLRETSVASDESINLASHCPSTDSHISVSMDGREEDLAQHMGMNDGNLTHGKFGEDDSKDHVERSFTAGFSFVDEQTSGIGNGSLLSEYENAGFGSDSRIAAVEAETGIVSSNIEREAGDGEKFVTFGCSLEDHRGSNFNFAASPSNQGPQSVSKRSNRRRFRTRTAQDSHSSTPRANIPLLSPTSNLFTAASISVQHDPLQGRSDIPFVLKTENESRAEKNIKPEASQVSISTTATSIAAQEACEKCRLRGNQAYANGYLSKAEDYYTRGVNSVSLNETSRSCIQALMLCYSNRAATRMSLGRMREAISDCKMALAIDPDFLRARVRAANCHLALGETEDALTHFRMCLQPENDVNCDQKILIEASEGLKKAQHVADYINQSTELLLKRTANDATEALRLMSEALSISPHSESLMEMKAEALLMLRRYEEVIQLCDQTLDLAEKNSDITGDSEQLKDVDSSEHRKISPERLWRWHLISKSYFHMGKVDEALELLQKHEKVKHLADKSRNKFQESSTSLAATIRELLRLKAAGNEAFQAGRHMEAVENYTSALACNTESRPFAAICFCNRAAAYQALGQITEAIADCSLAIALDSSYPKAISRRATLHEMIRDYGQAANDLNRLISLLERQSEDTDNISGMPVRSTGNCTDLKRACARLSSVEEEARKETPLDMYMILGVEPTSSVADVKKAYRKAALRHHPDKAGHFLTRSENVNDGLWREVAGEVHADADRLFKMIGEAYTILSDPTKRLQYDVEEEMRTALKKGYNGTGTPKTAANNYSSQYDRGVNRRQWRAYGSSHQRWSESSHSNR